MRLAWLSDIHLNFLDRGALIAFITNLAQTDCDAFLITGDIAEAPTLAAQLKVLDQSLARPIYFVLGNHDFYRSSFAKVRTEIMRLVRESSYLRYLSSSDTITLSPSTVLVGHDGWADGRLGDFHHSKVYMNDFELIEDFLGRSGVDDTQDIVTRAGLQKIMFRLAAEATSHFQRILPAAIEKAEHVIVATHVPPFREAAIHSGGVSHDDFLPFFASRIVGDYLRNIMTEHPRHRMTVYCGHAHGRGTLQILDNLLVECAGAEYGEPKIQQIITVD